MLERTLNGVRKRNATTRTPAQMRDGHRREYDPSAGGESEVTRSRPAGP